MRRTTEEVKMRRYLLGDLLEEERVRVEGQYLADPATFEELLATENDLIDAYVRGELSKELRHKFETEYFSTPERREKVEFARTLTQIASLARQSAPVPEISPWKRVWAALSAQQAIPQWAVVVTAFAIAGAGSWLMVQNQRLRLDLQQALAGQAEFRRGEDALRKQIAEFEGNPRDRLHPDQQGSEVAQLEKPMGSEVTLRLSPGMARDSGGQQKTLALSLTASHLQLQLMLDRDEYKTYEAVLETAQRKEVLRGKALQTHSIGGSTVVAWSLPARSMSSGDYIVRLAGKLPTGSLENVESYSFRVLRK
jgi:hypothetical protein